MSWTPLGVSHPMLMSIQTCINLLTKHKAVASAPFTGLLKSHQIFTESLRGAQSREMNKRGSQKLK